MKMNFYHRTAVMIAGFMLMVIPTGLAAQTTGSVEFSARIAPTGGRPAPVRQLTFYLLRKSLDEVRTEAAQLEPAPDLNEFIDGLSVSPALKAWMKKHHSVQLSGTDFTKSLTPDDIVDVPEYFDAFMSRNAGFKGVGFPNPKFKEKDRDANPAKYKQQKDEYEAAIRKFVVAMPESVQGIDIDLSNINPSVKWDHLLSEQKQRLDTRTFELAEQRYMAAKTDTDLEGRGSFSGIAPGSYWIGMIGEQAISGDVRLRWDLPVTVRPGETSRVELTNLNAMRPYRSAQNLNP